MLKKAEKRGSKVEGQHHFETLTLLYLKISLQHIHALDVPHCKLTYYLASKTKATAYHYFSF